MVGIAGICAANRGAGAGATLAAGPRHLRPCRRGASALHGQHALHQHHSQREAAAVPGQPGDRAPHQEHHPLECHGDGGARQPRSAGYRRPHFHLRLGGHAVRSRLQPFLPREGGGKRRRFDLFSGSRLARNLRPRLSGGPHHQKAAGEFPPRTGARRRPLFLSPSLADAQFLGVSHRIDGARPNHGHIPGAFYALSRRPRPEAENRSKSVGLSRRRRNRRA